MKFFAFFVLGVVLEREIFECVGLNLARNGRSLVSCVNGSSLENFSVPRPVSKDSVLGSVLDEFPALLEHFYGDGWLKFGNCGHYCGYNGLDGVTDEPVDECDSSCKTHDDCYGKAVEDGICTQELDPYLTPYEYDLTQVDDKICSGNAEGSCQLFICKCDLDMARRMGQLRQNATC